RRNCPGGKRAQEVGRESLDQGPRTAWEGREDSQRKGVDSQAHVPARFASRKVPKEESPAMDPFHPNTGPLPPTLRALAIGLLVETVVPMLDRSRGESPGARLPNEENAEGKDALWQNLRAKCDDLATLVLWADDPEHAAPY